MVNWFHRASLLEEAENGSDWLMFLPFLCCSSPSDEQAENEEISFSFICQETVFQEKIFSPVIFLIRRFSHPPQSAKENIFCPRYEEMAIERNGKQNVGGDWSWLCLCCPIQVRRRSHEQRICCLASLIDHVKNWFSNTSKNASSSVFAQRTFSMGSAVFLSSIESWTEKKNDKWVSDWSFSEFSSQWLTFFSLISNCSFRRTWYGTAAAKLIWPRRFHRSMEC